MSKPQEIVTIHGLAAGGAGVGRMEDGMVAFVEGVYPGDTALVRIDKAKKRHALATVVKLETPSPMRRRPECLHASDCGGCPWMGLKYDAQLEWKKNIVSQALARIGKVESSARAVVPSPKTIGYRGRIRLKGVCSSKGFSFAFRRRSSNSLASVKSCSVAHPLINQVMEGLVEFLSSRLTLAAQVGEAVLETDGQRCRLIIHPVGGINKNSVEGMVGAVERLDAAIVIQGDQVGAQCGDPWLRVEEENQPGMWLAPGAFSQANLSLNPALVEAVVRLSGLAEGDSGLDLYCGAGNYSIALASAGVAMTGVDRSWAAVDSAERSRQANELIKAHFTREDCLESASALAESKIQFDSVIVNPPRGGAGEVFKKAMELARRRVVYVACDPATLSRDAALALEAGFVMGQAEVYDMFPHTPHMETVAAFERRS
ncbi:MAG: methyltransferase [Nitrospinota bacterium]|nr:methyltransferase [Nitrospinota bacterium]MDH5678181.1 methyltransferase [Nitrospinota bacterium]MDH5757755.1 methyltransferase [Nitrospinota bacterium]